jgi:RNase P subunit RPR2
MLVQSTCQSLPLSRLLASESLRRPKCPRCGSVLHIAEESRFDVKGRIDRDWSCDNCGNKFVTSIGVWPR